MKDYSRFYTPDDVSDRLVDIACIRDGNKILEPSAGNGQIVKAILRKQFKDLMIIGCDVQYHDDREIRASIDQRTGNSYKFMHVEFLNEAGAPKPVYDCVIANPPFDDDTWVLHLMKMYEIAKDNSAIVCIVPEVRISTENNLWEKYINWYNDRLRGSIYDEYELKNWATNKDGTVTPIKIIRIIKLFI